MVKNAYIKGLRR